MIPGEEGRHYAAVKKIISIIKGMALKHDGDFYCLICLHFFRTKKLKFHKIGGVVMPYEENVVNLIRFHQLFM